MEIEEKDIDFQGEQQKWKSGVKIKKCRYLEESGCVGLCMNLCKVWTEALPFPCLRHAPHHHVLIAVCAPAEAYRGFFCQRVWPPAHNES